ncbi:MAG: hypothetical protein Nkreftii_003038 [Candidatus Nitrospira kreftii]|uniref:SGNH hydrolase-type esterase domain-containing protein n=1 Tax=Candidatus Nitrospira kreftii TaxID=2652173 RepID=A0A7S8J0M8_9BACT|nr:MAG: hypothetical protein Nkreftii_003038 [Candidatus Nitrospira kreftii]
MTSETALSKRELLLLISIFVFESAIAVVVIAMYMKGQRSFQVFLSSRPGVALLCAVAALLISGTDLVHRYLVHKRSPSGRFRMVVMMNFVSVLLIVLAGEMAVRIGSRNYMDGEAFGNVVLKPRNWDKAIHRQLVESSSGDRSDNYVIYDDWAGWTVEPNRCSANGLYCSSSEGLRAPRDGIVFPKTEKLTNIALIGDSFTFGNEVSYEETWGHKLNQMLGDEFLVLNFGVGGYGLGQSFVRYEKDVRKRRPNIVIFSFISHDLFRTMWVYPFIAMPEWNMPFSKPRFILRDGELVNLNRTPLSTEAIFSAGSISDLPLLNYDQGYRASDWQTHWYHFFYLIRLLTSLFPPWEAAGPDSSGDGLIATNAAILKTFVRSVKEEGSVPLVVFLPMKMDLGREASYVSLGKQVLEQVGIPYLDATPCVSEVNSADRFLENHYSPQGNEAVAKCVYTTMKESLPFPVPG